MDESCTTFEYTSTLQHSPADEFVRLDALTKSPDIGVFHSCAVRLQPWPMKDVYSLFPDWSDLLTTTDSSSSSSVERYATQIHRREPLLPFKLQTFAEG